MKKMNHFLSTVLRLSSIGNESHFLRLDENASDSYDVLFSFDQLPDRELMDVREIRFYVKIPPSLDRCWLKETIN